MFGIAGLQQQLHHADADLGFFVLAFVVDAGDVGAGLGDDGQHPGQVAGFVHQTGGDLGDAAQFGKAC